MNIMFLINYIIATIKINGSNLTKDLSRTMIQPYIDVLGYQIFFVAFFGVIGIMIYFLSEGNKFYAFIYFIVTAAIFGFLWSTIILIIVIIVVVIIMTWIIVDTVAIVKRT